MSLLQLSEEFEAVAAGLDALVQDSGDDEMAGLRQLVDTDREREATMLVRFEWARWRDRPRAGAGLLVSMHAAECLWREVEGGSPNEVARRIAWLERRARRRDVDSADGRSGGLEFGPDSVTGPAMGRLRRAIGDTELGALGVGMLDLLNEYGPGALDSAVSLALRVVAVDRSCRAVSTGALA
ncbi:hypothetical protein [Patulibacter medicamentivorans]|uniref:hypothetical protein n=1 Tax=Patulibacter medicamentivorans TaxID=1097667 RepID=UPI00058AC307|nr:hypothetical protein [Patulibacter medicamentivorans]